MRPIGRHATRVVMGGKRGMNFHRLPKTMVMILCRKWDKSPGFFRAFLFNKTAKGVGYENKKNDTV